MSHGTQTLQSKSGSNCLGYTSIVDEMLSILLILYTKIKVSITAIS